MILSKNKVLFLFIISTFLILVNSGCTRKVQDTSVLTLTIPHGMSSKISDFQHSEPMSMQSVSVQNDDGDDGGNWNPFLNPEELSGFNCYMITVSGPESDMRRNTCITTTGQNFKVGRWIGGLTAGTTLSLEVPSGTQREITVVGFNATSGSCVDFKRFDVNKMSMSEPHILGKIVRDLSPGTVSVTIPVSVSTETLKMDDCSGPDFDMDGSDGLYFGDVTAGNVVVSSVESYTSLGGASYAVTGFENEPLSPNQDATFITTTVTPSGLGPNDEIIITNPAQSGTWTPSVGTPHTGPCGYRLWEGRYAFARVKSVSVSPPGVYIYKGTPIDSLNWDPTTQTFDAGLKSTINGRMTATPTADGSFCKLQISKVLHFWDLTLDPGAMIEAQSLDINGSTSGILPIRVANNLTLNDGSSINATTRGFGPIAGYHGKGVRGQSLMGCTGPFSSNTGTGGSCAPNDGSGYGAGGGGNGTAPGSGNVYGPSGGAGGGGTQSGGYGAGDDCGDGSCFGALRYKIFWGGSGGSSGDSVASMGGEGGGVVYLMAKNITVATGGNAAIVADGGFATGNSSIPNQGAGGGGAGGSVFIGYGNLSLTTGTNTYLTVSTNGGDGGEASQTASSGGGGGGGGRIHIAGCTQSIAPVTSSAIVTAALGGAGGVAYGGGDIGFPGFGGSVVRQSLQCP